SLDFPELQGIDVDRQLPLAPHVVPNVLVTRNEELRADAQPHRQVGREAPRLQLAEAVVALIVRRERGVLPDESAVTPPVAAEGPARQGLARIPLALAEVQQAARGEAVAQPAQQHAGQLALTRSQRKEVPFLPVAVVDRQE